MAWETAALLAGYVVGACVVGRGLADRDRPTLLAGGGLALACFVGLAIRLVRAVYG